LSVRPHDALAETLLGHNGGPPLDPDEIISRLTDEQVAELLSPLLEAEEAERFTKFERIFPEGGPLRRELYRRHMEFFKVGAQYNERLFMAGNRVGKTVAGSFEVCSHATGLYREWWEGRRFTHPTHGWAAGDTNETTRDIIQKELFGDVAWVNGRKTFDGTGMIPRDCIGPASWKRGVDNLADVVRVKHITGGWSTIGLKSYDQGRRVFQGTAKHWIWLDEEPPVDVYGECLIRLMTTRGILLLTFTPLSGMSEVVLSFQDDDVRPST
jgi:phage terminase large subunit-like protein